MRYPLFLLCLILPLLGLGQRPANGSSPNRVLVCEFDSVKVYVNYPDLVAVLRPHNQKMGDPSVLRFHNDTLVLDRYFLYRSQNTDSLSLTLDVELFGLINAHKAQIWTGGNPVDGFYRRHTKRATHGCIYFRGIAYYDRATHTHLIIQTMYRRHYTPATVRF